MRDGRALEGVRGGKGGETKGGSKEGGTGTGWVQDGVDSYWILSPLFPASLPLSSPQTCASYSTPYLSEVF